jgi:hypothetical protein
MDDLLRLPGARPFFKRDRGAVAAVFSRRATLEPLLPNNALE